MRLSSLKFRNCLVVQPMGQHAKKLSLLRRLSSGSGSRLRGSWGDLSLNPRGASYSHNPLVVLRLGHEVGVGY